MKKILFTICLILYIGSSLLFAQDFQTLPDDFTNWNDDTGWNGTNSPGRFINGDEVEINGSVIYDDSNYGGDPLVIDGFGTTPQGTLTITNGSTLLIRGDLNVPTGGGIFVEPGGTLIVDGNFNSTGGFLFFDGGATSNEGRVAVTGNYTQGASGSYAGTGEVNVAGTSTEANPPGFQTIPPDLQAIINDPTTLPIELKSFNGQLTKSKSTQLEWVTAKEENFSHFEVQRSINNQEFEVIGHVKGQGDSNSDVYYSFTDRNVPYGIVRYRLNAVDIDESFEIFEAIEIQNTFSDQLKAFPNPFREITDLKIVVPEDIGDQLDKVTLYDYSGKLLYTKMDYELFNGQIIIDNLKAGMYILNITHNGLTESIRVIKE